MRALLQRVTEASVVVDGRSVGAIGRGLLILLGVHRDDTAGDAAWVARKSSNLRIFPDADGRMNHSVINIKGEVLVVSQFTLYGDARKGNRPSYVEAAEPTAAERLYEQFVEEVARVTGRPVATGIFGAAMQVHLVNDGPVTLLVERGPAHP